MAFLSAGAIVMASGMDWEVNPNRDRIALGLGPAVCSALPAAADGAVFRNEVYAVQRLYSGAVTVGKNGFDSSVDAVMSTRGATSGCLTSMEFRSAMAGRVFCCAKFVEI